MKRAKAMRMLRGRYQGFLRRRRGIGKLYRGGRGKFKPAMPMQSHRHATRPTAQRTLAALSHGSPSLDSGLWMDWVNDGLEFRGTIRQLESGTLAREVMSQAPWWE